MSIILILIGMALLYVGGELLVYSATRLARLFGVSPLVIGLTIVAFGTSCPELAAMLIAALREKPEIAVGAIIGSNISNIALILGLSALTCPLVAKLKFIKREVPFMLVTSALFFPLAWLGGIGRMDGFLLLCLLAAYIWYVYTKSEQEETEENDYTRRVNRAYGKMGLSIIGIAIAIACLSGGAHSLIEGAVMITRRFGVPEKIIGLTLVALGTSLPELASCLVAAYRKETDIILGNIIGSNIFNVLGILGATALVCPFDIHISEIFVDLCVMMGISLIFVPCLATGLRLGRKEGAFLFSCYIIYMGYLYTQI